MSDFQKIYMRRFGTSTISSTLTTTVYFESTVAQTTQSISTYTPTDHLNSSESFEELNQLTCLIIGIFFAYFYYIVLQKKFFYMKR